MAAAREVAAEDEGAPCAVAAAAIVAVRSTSAGASPSLRTRTSAWARRRARSCSGRSSSETTACGATRDARRGGADAAAAGERDHAQRPLGGFEVGVGRDVDGDVGLALLARGDVDGAREDLGPAGGHALDGQLEVLGARGLVVHAHDEARVRGRLDDDLRRPGVIRASRHAERDADGVPMPSCSPFAEHLVRG